MRHERDLARMAGAVPAGRQDGEPERAAGIGAPLRRLEDERLLRGSGRFTGDLAAGSGALAMAACKAGRPAGQYSSSSSSMCSRNSSPAARARGSMRSMWNDWRSIWVK